MITRRSFFAASAAPLLAKKKEAPKKPNILLIIADDVSSWMLGCYGNQEIKTPNIDILARSGARFINSFACAPVASVNRDVLRTGRTPMQKGGDGSLGSLLEAAGYVCAAAKNDTRQALDFLDKQQAGKPFGLLAAYDAGLPSENRLAEYQATRFDTIGWERPASNAAKGKEFLKDTVANIRKAAAAVSALDDQVKFLMTKLQQRGLRDETLVVFTSAAGQYLGRHGLWGDGTASEPVSMFDDVLAVPLLWSWLGKAPAELSRADVVSSYDLLPSICDAVGIQAPAGLCGESFVRLAANAPLKKKEVRRTTIFGHYGNAGMARDSRYKLVIRNNGEGPNELYDVRVDPKENVNQYENQGFVTVRDRLRRGLAAWEKQYS